MRLDWNLTKTCLLKGTVASRVGSTIKALNYAGDTRNRKVGDLAENLAVDGERRLFYPLFYAFYPGEGGCASSKDGNRR